VQAREVEPRLLYARFDDGLWADGGDWRGADSRVDARRSRDEGVLPLAGTVAASDAFFPFPDGLEAVAEAGATAAIQPGRVVANAR